MAGWRADRRAARGLGRAGLAVVSAEPGGGRGRRYGGGGAGGRRCDLRSLRQPSAPVRCPAVQGDRGNHRSGQRPGGIADRIKPSPGHPQFRARPGRLRERTDRTGPALDDRELEVGSRGRRSGLATGRPRQPGSLAALPRPNQGGPLPPRSRRCRGLQPRRQDRRSPGSDDTHGAALGRGDGPAPRPAL